MARGKFSYSQFKAMYKNMQTVQRDFDEFIHNFLLEEALIALRLVRPLTPVDTGNLRRNWSISNVERTGTSLVVYLVNPTEYGSFMEEGMTIHSQEGDYWFEGFHMAELSLLQVRQKMPAKFSREFERWIVGKGWKK